MHCLQYYNIKNINKDVKMKITIDISDHTIKELEYIIELHDKYEAPNPKDSVENLIQYVLASVTDGSRRPGAWERGLLDAMGLVADCDEHYIYRHNSGAPTEDDYEFTKKLNNP